MSVLPVRRLVLPMLALLALAWLVAMVVTGSQPVQRQLVRFEARGVLRAEPETVRKVTVGDGGRQAVLVRGADGNWAREAGGAVDGAAATHLETALKMLRRSGPVREIAPEELAGVDTGPFGLDRPVVVATVWGIGGQPLTVRFGALNPEGFPAIHAHRRRPKGLPDVALHRHRMGRGARRRDGAVKRAGIPAAVIGALFAVAAAMAHQGGTTGYATVSVDGQSVRFALALPAEGLGDAARDLSGLAATIARQVVVEADGAACSGVPAGTRPPAAGRNSVEVVVLYACTAKIRTLSIRDGTDSLLGPDHHTIADIEWPGGARQVVFEPGQRQVSVTVASGEETRSNAFVSFVALGVEHIVGGIDHLLFLLALLAVVRTVWQTVKIVTAFTLAHSVTLSLAALGLVEVPSAIVEPLIAASIVWVALENLFAPQNVGRRWLVAALFGLVHGLGFASALTDLGLSRGAMVQALLGFNIGVELGQLAFIAVVLPPLVWASRPGRLARLPQALSVVVALLGAVWLVERVVA